jgi:hypothetical protein
MLDTHRKFAPHDNQAALNFKEGRGPSGRPREAGVLADDFLVFGQIAEKRRNCGVLPQPAFRARTGDRTMFHPPACRVPAFWDVLTCPAAFGTESGKRHAMGLRRKYANG